MSAIRRALNTYLRWTEKRQLARADDIDALRRSFERRARVFFHGPFGSQYRHDRLGDVAVQWATARGVAHEHGPMVLYFHGGGYVFGSTTTHRALAARLSDVSQLPVCLVEYRRAPEYPFPTAVNDALIAYRALPHRPVILGGDSAGGGLALALLAQIITQDLPRPRGAFAFSALTDMTFSGASLRDNAAAEVMLPTARISEIAQAYLAGAASDDPRASPLFAEFTGAPPVWLTVGTTEILRDDTTRLADRLRAQGVDVTVKLQDDLPHVWPIFQNILPEARATLRDLAGWIRRQTD